MAKLKVQADFLGRQLFRGSDKCPIIYGASWDDDSECVVLDIMGEGVPDNDAEVVAIITRRTPVTIEFKET